MNVCNTEPLEHCVNEGSKVKFVPTIIVAD